MERPRWRTALYTVGPFAIVMAVVIAIWIVYHPPYSLIDWTRTSVELVPAVALLWHRKAPVPVLVICTVAALMTAVTAYLTPGLFEDSEPGALWVHLATPFAIASAVKRGINTRLVWTCVVVLILIATRPWSPSFTVISGGAVFTVYPMLMGLYIASRHRAIRMWSDRAERAEREQELLAEQARAEERTRLAGEMHDVVTHRVSLMVLQAGVLRMTGPDEATRAAAEELRVAGCQALEELRELVGVLRSTPGEDTEPDTGAAVPDVSELVAESEAVGVSVKLLVEGNPLLTSAVVGRTAYRIVQEGLTNVRKHAPGSETLVHLRYGGDRVHLTIRNTAPSEPGDEQLGGSGSGTGLLGLRQRVELVRGTLNAGPRPDGGFELDATLPAFVPTSESHGA